MVLKAISLTQNFENYSYWFYSQTTDEKDIAKFI